MPPDISDEDAEQITAALRVIFQTLMLHGNDFLQGYLLADGRTFRVKIEIKEVIE